MLSSNYAATIASGLANLADFTKDCGTMATAIAVVDSQHDDMIHDR